jgi:hypothetical protein
MPFFISLNDLSCASDVPIAEFQLAHAIAFSLRRWGSLATVMTQSLNNFAQEPLANQKNTWLLIQEDQTAGNVLVWFHSRKVSKMSARASVNRHSSPDARARHSPL